MSTSISYPGTASHPGSPTAKASAAGAVIALATAIAGTALVAGIATGSAIEAPEPPAPTPVTTVVVDETPPITTSPATRINTTGGGYLGPLRVD